MVIKKRGVKRVALVREWPFPNKKVEVTRVLKRPKNDTDDLALAADILFVQHEGKIDNVIVVEKIKAYTMGVPRVKTEGAEMVAYKILRPDLLMTWWESLDERTDEERARSVQPGTPEPEPPSAAL